MEVVRFLERKIVIRFFGIALILAPFINIFLHLWVLKNQNNMMWAQVNFAYYFKSVSPVSYFLALCGVVIGLAMLGGAVKAWRYTLVFIGIHLVIQIVNINNKAWQSPLAWPTFLLNSALFFFILDQLVWKVKPINASQVNKANTVNSQKAANVLSDLSDTNASNTPDAPEVQNQLNESNTVVPLKGKKVVNLKSYRKILFSFGSDKPWGELKTLSSEVLSVKSFAPVPESIEHRTVQINFAKDVVIEIKFDHRENEMYYFKPLNMEKENIVKLNRWLRRIAV